MVEEIESQPNEEIKVNAESKLFKNLPILVLLILAGAMVYTLPYFKGNFYDTFLNYYHLNNTQMGSLSSAFGLTSIFSYFFGGLLADKFRTKNLLTFSLVATGLLGYAMLTYPPYPVLLAIYALWGVTSILTFWSALVKATRSIAGSNEQSKAFGFFEGGRGITNMIMAVIVLSMFARVAGSSSDKVALSSVIILYSTINVALGILIFMLYKEPESTKDINLKDKKYFDFPAMKKVMKMPTTWLSVLIIFCSYSTLIGYYYITPYATNVFGATAVVGAALTYLAQYCRPIGAFLAGIFGDRIGSSKMAAIAYALMILGLVGVSITPTDSQLIWIFIASIAVLYASMYAVQSMHFAILEEGDYPLELTGTATAVITPLGYSAEFFIPIIAGLCLDYIPGVAGFKTFFAILIALAVIGLLAVLMWMKLTTAKRAALAEARLASKNA